MAKDNGHWGAERIRGELMKLDTRVSKRTIQSISKRTIQRYMRRLWPPGGRDQTWYTFISNHRGGIGAHNFLQLSDVLSRPIFASFFVIHGTREVVHFQLTCFPTNAWAAQQLQEATPYCYRPTSVLRNKDCEFGQRFAAVAEASEIEVVKIPPHSPNLSPICERFLGPVRGECLDHLVILSKPQPRRVL